ncbi:hypothetical protein KM043_018251 [Ampulex compressa]|nr:hypothetical protein KM043_018251 [Ampulex compressa]
MDWLGLGEKERGQSVCWERVEMGCLRDVCRAVTRGEGMVRYSPECQRGKSVESCRLATPKPTNILEFVYARMCFMCHICLGDVSRYKVLCDTNGEERTTRVFGAGCCWGRWAGASFSQGRQRTPNASLVFRGALSGSTLGAFYGLNLKPIPQPNDPEAWAQQNPEEDAEFCISEPLL